jgi:hypothetical protein
MMTKPMVYCWFTVGITPSDAFLSCLQIVGLQIAYYIPAAGRMPEWREFGWQMRQKGRFWMLRMERRNSDKHQPVGVSGNFLAFCIMRERTYVRDRRPIEQ